MGPNTIEHSPPLLFPFADKNKGRSDMIPSPAFVLPDCEIVSR